MNRPGAHVGGQRRIGVVEHARVVLEPRPDRTRARAGIDDEARGEGGRAIVEAIGNLMEFSSRSISQFGVRFGRCRRARPRVTMPGVLEIVWATSRRPMLTAHGTRGSRDRVH